MESEWRDRNYRREHDRLCSGSIERRYGEIARRPQVTHLGDLWTIDIMIRGSLNNQTTEFCRLDGGEGRHSVQGRPRSTTLSPLRTLERLVTIYMTIRLRCRPL